MKWNVTYKIWDEVMTNLVDSEWYADLMEKVCHVLILTSADTLISITQIFQRAVIDDLLD